MLKDLTFVLDWSSVVNGSKDDGRPPPVPKGGAAVTPVQLSHRKTSRACTQPHRYKHNYNTQQQPPATGFFFFFYALVSFR
ncbi:hypothetical protein Q3G72_025696 [Acer saccharum]|nr:hypothetical protein Q3G72_025696 [Acer saccharum]